MKIAIVGTGISGLASAYLLNPDHQITVYEINDYIGGHSRTVDVSTASGITPVDTGFIVFNYRNYPLLTGLFNHLGVAVEKSDMSFGVSIHNGWFEYSTQTLSTLFAQKQNLVRWSFWKMVMDILRFNRHSSRYLHAESSVTLGECLDQLKVSEWFKQYYILAMGGAIWSCPLETMLAFPASSFLRFFDNHGLLTVNDQPQWYTVSGGSREYIKKLTASFKHNIRINCGVSQVDRHNQSVTVLDTNGQSEQFDHIVFSSHADQTLAMLDNPDQHEQAVLSAFQYQNNTAILHSDESFMPQQKKCWASWVYLNDQKQDKRGSISLSYWMNNLQNLNPDPVLIVTLNPSGQHVPDPAKIHDQFDFEHPIFNQSAIDAQQRINSIQGQNNCWYCGAYQRNGFHEDGLHSAVEVAKKMGAHIPWQ